MLQEIDELLADIRRAVELHPRSAAAHHHLGEALAYLRRDEEAADCFRRAISLEASFARAHYHLGVSLARLGQAREAEISLQTARSLDPDAPAVYQHLAAVLDSQHKAEAAAECLRQAIARWPNSAELHTNLGVILTQSGQAAEAIRCFQRAIELDPTCADALSNLGSLLSRESRPEEALAWHRRALAVRPDFEGAAQNLASTLLEVGRAEEARACYAATAARHPQQPLWELCRISVCPNVFLDSNDIVAYRRRLLDELEQFAERRLVLSPTELQAHGSTPSFNLPFHGLDERPIREAYANVYARSFPATKAPGSRGRARIGIVVTQRHEFAFHKSLGGVIDRLDPAEFEIRLYVSRAGGQCLASAYTNTSVAIHWLPTTLDRAAEALRDDQLDVLYYWEVGTDNLNYFLPFYRLAPVQCTSWGIQVTTGIPQVDYYLSSALVEPPAAADHYRESLLLADTLLTYQLRMPESAPRKSREQFSVDPRATWYVCAQRAEKIQPDFDLVLAEILRRDPRGVVVLTASRHGAFVASQLRARLDRMADVASRIVLLPFQMSGDYLDLIRAADVLLDPLHFGGVNSTYDGLSLARPIVTMAGPYHRSRYTAGCYAKMNVNDCVAASAAQYVEIAVQLGTDVDYRASVSASIREASDALFNDRQAVSEHERIFRLLVDEARRRAD